jgi:glutamate decarboxylase
MLRALVKLDLPHTMVEALADDVHEACETLEKKGGASKEERRKVRTNVGM